LESSISVSCSKPSRNRFARFDPNRFQFVISDAPLLFATVFLGLEYDMVDLHGYPIFERFPAMCMLGVDALPSGKYPRLSAWIAAMQQMECVRRVWISPKMHRDIIAGYQNGKVDYDTEIDDETIAVQKSVT